MARSSFWVELVCDACSRTTAGRTVAGSAIPVREMTAEAKRSGWKKSAGGTDLCRDCAKKTNNLQEPEA